MQRKLVDSDMVGTWKLTPASLSLFKREGYVAGIGETYSMTLNADGTLQFSSIVDDANLGKYMTGDGNWQLQHDMKFEMHLDTRTNVLEIDFIRDKSNGLAIHNRTFGFIEIEGKLRFWTFFGDPDSSELIEYEKQ